MQFSLARMSFRVARHAGPDPATGQFREVFQQPKAAVVGPGRFPCVTTDGENLGNTGIVAVPDYTGQLRPAFDASCGQVRNNLKAEVGKLDGCANACPYTFAGQAGHRQRRPGRYVGLDAGGNALSGNDLNLDRQLPPETAGGLVGRH
nr:hypothetical protein [Arthrobacter oryzae]